MKKYIILLFLIVPFLCSAQLIKSSDSDKVYLISNNQKRWIQTANIFNSYNLKWSDIQVSAPSKFTDNTLVKLSTGDKVYFLDTELHWIPTAEVFENKGFKWADIQTINQKEFEAYKIGSELNISQKSSATTAKIDMETIIAPYSCSLGESCHIDPSPTDSNNTPVATIKISVIPTGFENAKISKLILKQVGSLSIYDYSDFQLWFNGKKYLPEKDLTFTFDNLNLAGNISNNFTLTADIYTSATGKFYQFKFESAELTGEISGLPANYSVSNSMTTGVVVNVLKN